MVDQQRPDATRLPVSRAAKKLNVSERTLWRWMGAGTIPYTIVNGRRVVDISEKSREMSVTCHRQWQSKAEYIRAVAQELLELAKDLER